MLALSRAPGGSAGSNEVAIKAVAWALERTGITPIEKLVLICVAEHADQDGNAFPGVARIARLCCVSTRTVQRSLIQLKNVGLLEIFPRFQGRSQSSNLYILRIDSDRAPSLGQEGDKLTPHDITAIPAPTQEVKGGDSAVAQTKIFNHQFNQRSSHEDLEIPRVFDGRTMADVFGLLDGLPRHVAQLLLDEIAGRSELVTIRNPIGYLSSLLRQHQDSTFEPALALQYRERRNKAVEMAVAAEAAKSAERERRSKLDPERNAQRLRDLLDKLKLSSA